MSNLNARRIVFGISAFSSRAYPIDCESDILPFKRLAGFYELVDYGPRKSDPRALKIATIFDAPL